MSSKFPMNSQHPQKQQPPQVKVDLSKATDVVCEVCSNYTFSEVVMMKELSELVSPNGKRAFIPIPVFACNACGFVNKAFLPPSMRGEEEQPKQPEQRGTFDALGRTITDAPIPSPTKIELAK